MKHEDRLQRMARLVVEVGANVQPGQTVAVTGYPEHAPLMRDIASAAYRAGAASVYPDYVDKHFDRALSDIGPEPSQSLRSAGGVAMLDALVARNGAATRIVGEPAPDLLKDLD